MRQLIEAVKNYANENYESGGWDIVVECWSDADIAAQILRERASTEEEAIDAFRPLVAIWIDQQEDARNSAF